MIIIQFPLLVSSEPHCQAEFQYIQNGQLSMFRLTRELFFFPSVSVTVAQCRSKGEISGGGGGARERRRHVPLGGSGGMPPRKSLKSRGLEVLFPAFSKSHL